MPSLPFALSEPPSPRASRDLPLLRLPRPFCSAHMASPVWDLPQNEVAIFGQSACKSLHLQALFDGQPSVGHGQGEGQAGWHA